MYKDDESSTTIHRQSSNASDATMIIKLAVMDPVNDNSSQRPTVFIKDSIVEAPNDNSAQRPTVFIKDSMAEELEDKRIS